MGTLPLSSLIAEVRSHHGERDDLTDARIVSVLNLMQERMARAYDFEELRKVESGTLTFVGNVETDRFINFSDLTIFTNPREIYSVRIKDDPSRRAVKLQNWSVREFDKRVPESDFFATGFPSIYIKYADKLQIHRIPDKAYSFEIRGSVWPTAFSESVQTATSDFDKKDDLLITIAVSYLFGSYGEYERSNRFFGIFSRLFEEAISEDAEVPDRDLVPEAGRAKAIATNPNYWIDPLVKGVR